MKLHCKFDKENQNEKTYCKCRTTEEREAANMKRLLTFLTALSFVMTASEAGKVSVTQGNYH